MGTNTQGTLLDYTLALQRGEVRHFTPSQFASLFIGICSALQMMHSEYELAHRDIKPGNILLGGEFTPGVTGHAGGGARGDRTSVSNNTDEEDSDDEENGLYGDSETLRLSAVPTARGSGPSSSSSSGTAGLHGVLIDFGSCGNSRTMISSRAQALEMQEDAERNCTAPYRSPELWDVPSECVIDEKIDIWSLGCTMYACLFGKSPFESAIEESGGSLMLAVMSGKAKWWADADSSRTSGASPTMPYPECVYFKAIIEKMLSVDSMSRPSAEQVAVMLERVGSVSTT